MTEPKSVVLPITPRGSDLRLSGSLATDFHLLNRSRQDLCRFAVENLSQFRLRGLNWHEIVPVAGKLGRPSPPRWAPATRRTCPNPPQKAVKCSPPVEVERCKWQAGCLPHFVIGPALRGGELTVSQAPAFLVAGGAGEGGKQDAYPTLSLAPRSAGENSLSRRHPLSWSPAEPARVASRMLTPRWGSIRLGNPVGRGSFLG